MGEREREYTEKGKQIQFHGSKEHDVRSFVMSVERSGTEQDVPSQVLCKRMEGPFSGSRLTTVKKVSLIFYPM